MEIQVKIISKLIECIDIQKNETEKYDIPSIVSFTDEKLTTTNNVVIPNKEILTFEFSENSFN